MKTAEALKVLKIDSENPETGDVIKSFNRMSRRYPQTSFPDKYALLLQAKEKLLGKQDQVSFHDYLFENQLDMTWANKHLKPKEKKIIKSFEHRKLEIFMRPFFEKGPDAFEGSFSFSELSKLLKFGKR